MTLDHLTRQYSERLGVLTAAQLQAALDRFDLGELLDATSASGGVNGQNVVLTSTSGQYILRGLPLYDWQLAKERFFAELIHERTDVPVPLPYLIEESPDLFGWSYAIMPRLPGLPLADPAVRNNLDESERLAIAGALGRTLAALHEITWPEWGEYYLATNTITPIETSFRDWTLARVEREIDDCVSLPVLTPADLLWCRELVQQNADSLDIPVQPTLVHHDYKEGNVVVQQTGDSWDVSGLFDLVECYFGDPEEDFVRCVSGYQQERSDSPLSKAFLHAYSDIKPLRPNYRERFAIYMLRDCLLIWAFGHRDGRNWFRASQSFRAFAEPHVLSDPFP